MDNQLIIEVPLKQCPFCGEDINIEALKCPFCKSWLDGRDVAVSSTNSRFNPVASTDGEKSHNSFEDFLDKVSAHVTHPTRLHWLCIAAIILSIYSCITSCFSSDEYYSSGLLNAIVSFDEHLGWLMELLTAFTNLCILLGLRIVLKRHKINSWISLCIAVSAISMAFDLISSNWFVTLIPALGAGFLEIEFCYKMYRSTIEHIKSTGTWGMIMSTLSLTAWIMLVPWFIAIIFDEGGSSRGIGSFMALMCFISIKYFLSLKKLFKIEYPT